MKCLQEDPDVPALDRNPWAHFMGGPYTVSPPQEVRLAHSGECDKPAYRRARSASWSDWSRKSIIQGMSICHSSSPLLFSNLELRGV